MDRSPLLLTGAAAALGAIAAHPLSPGARLLSLCACAALCAWIAFARPELGRFRALAGAALALGWCSAYVHGTQANVAPSKAHRFDCTVLDQNVQPDFTTFACAAGAMKLAVTARSAPPVGTHVLLRGRIEPFDGPRNPGEPDQRAIEAERGIAARVSSAQVLRVLPPAPLTLDIAIANAHAWALQQLREQLPEPSASILAGELWGERSALPPELRAEFQETGTVHVLVTAGLHLGVVAALIFFVLRGLSVPRIAACVFAMAMLWIYAGFSGSHLPAIRAATMITFALLAYACGRATRAWNVYGAALLAIVLLEPASIASASFALSFSCVGAIFLCAGIVNEQLERVALLPARVREALALTISTQLGTWPLTASVFLLFAPYAVFANAVVVPCIGATMLLGGLQLFLAPVPQLAQAAANINSWLLAWIVAAIHWIAALPASSFAAMPPPLTCIIGYDALLIAAVGAWNARVRTAAAAFFLTGVLLVALPPRPIDHRLRITVLDVGQGDGIVIRTPLGHTFLVDTGGRLERGKQTESAAEAAATRIVPPFLHREGIRTIDAILITHPHGDHAGGAAPVMREFSTNEFADSGQRYGGFAYNDALAVAHDRHVPIVYPRAGTVWQTDDGITLTFLGPSLPLLADGNNDVNNNSLVFLLQYRHFRMLFTGDAGTEAEERFLHEGIDLRADVLKVGHHGSAYSSSPEFIAAVHPRDAIVSVGRHNLYGHPAPTTLATLQRFGARIYRTDENGAVDVATDGQSSTVETMVP